MDPLPTLMAILFPRQIFKVYRARPFKVYPAVPTRLSALPAERATDPAQAPYKDFNLCKESITFKELMTSKVSLALVRVEKVMDHASVPCRESLLSLLVKAKDSEFSIQ